LALTLKKQNQKTINKQAGPNKYQFNRRKYGKSNKNNGGG
jgi:hypothetical protein